MVSCKPLPHNYSAVRRIFVTAKKQLLLHCCGFGGGETDVIGHCLNISYVLRTNPTVGRFCCGVELSSSRTIGSNKGACPNYLQFLSTRSKLS